MNSQTEKLKGFRDNQKNLGEPIDFQVFNQKDGAAMSFTATETDNVSTFGFIEFPGRKFQRSVLNTGESGLTSFSKI